MNRKWGRWLAPLAVVALVAAACGDDNGDDDADDTTTTTEAEATTTTEADTGAEGPGSVSCSDLIPDCEGTITPAEGLTDGATVTIEASGFTPNTGLGVTQCADEDDPDHGIEGETGPEECNLRNIPATESDAEGNVSVEFTVVAGETMVENTAGGYTCDAEHDCVVSVGQLVPGEAERVTFKVSFA